MYLLDTNVVSELRKLDASRCDPNVAEWAAGVQSQEQWLSANNRLRRWSQARIGRLGFER
jgi:predicted nucleic acid-binding protein